LKAYHSIQAWFPFIFGCSKNPYIHYKTMFTCWVSLFCNEFTLGPGATLVHIMYPCWESALWWSLHVLFYLLLFLSDYHPKKEFGRKIKTFEAKKKTTLGKYGFIHKCLLGNHPTMTLQNWRKTTSFHLLCWKFSQGNWLLHRVSNFSFDIPWKQIEL